MDIGRAEVCVADEYEYVCYGKINPVDKGDGIAQAFSWISTLFLANLSG